jgi:putative membrane protein
MSSFLAFLHHAAAFALVSALLVECVLIQDDLSVRSARKLQTADLVFGISAGVVLVVGLLRVFYFEKGASYYLHSIPFLGKFCLFIIVALLSIYPTVEFLSWRNPLKQGHAPTVSERKRRAIRSIVRYELAGLVLLILCAALMAKGVGYRG